MRRSCSRIAFAASFITLFAASGCDSSTGARSQSIALSLSTTSLALAQGASQQVTVTVDRSNFDGAVGLSVQGTLPPGVTVEFAQSSLPAAATTTLMTVSAAGNAPPSSSESFTVRATGEGVTEQTAAVDLSIAVTGSYALGMLDPSINVAQGGGGNATVLITRTGGNAGDVALTVGTLPAGVTAAFAEGTTTGNAGSLIITAGAGVAPGTYPVSITGTSPGHTPDQTTTLSLVVTAPPATSNVTMTFCASEVPVWFAYRNEGYSWQVATPTGGAFTFPATERVSVAFVFTSTGESRVSVFHMVRSEVAAYTDQSCAGTRTHNGTVTGLSTGQSAYVVLGSSADLADASTPTFTLTEVASRPLDLVATRGIVAAGTLPSPDRIIVRRGVDLPSGSAIPDLGFTAAESFAPASHTATVSSVPASSDVLLQNSLVTSSGTFGLVQFADVTTFPASLYFVPADRMIAGDLHEFYVNTVQSNGFIGQGYVDYTTTVGDRSISMGPPLNPINVSMVTTAPYARFRATVASQPEYGTIARFLLGQARSGSSFLFVTTLVTASYLGGTPTTWDLLVPDFSGAAGFNATWMPVRGPTTPYLVETYGGPADILFGAQPTAGSTYRFAYRESSMNTLLRLRARDLRPERPPVGQYLSR